MDSKEEFNFSVPPPLSIIKGLNEAREEGKVDRLREIAKKALKDLQEEKEKYKALKRAVDEKPASPEKQNDPLSNSGEMEKKFQNSQAELRAWERKYQAAKKENEDLEKKCNESRDAQQELDSKHVDLKKSYDILVAENESLGQALEKKNQELEAPQDPKLLEAEDRYNILSATNKRLEKQLAEIKSEKEDVDFERQELQDEVRVLSQKSEKATHQLQTLEDEVADLKATYSPSKELLSKSIGPSHETPGPSQDEAAEKSTISQLNDVQHKLVQEKASNAALHEQITEMRKEIKKFSSDPKSYHQDDNDDTKTRLHSLEDELSDADEDDHDDAGAAGDDEKKRITSDSRNKTEAGKELVVRNESHARPKEISKKSPAGTIIVDVIQTYTQNPIRCWLQTELNIAVLIIFWAISIWKFIVPYIRSAGLAPVGGPVSPIIYRPRSNSVDSADSFFTETSDSGSVALDTIIPVNDEQPSKEEEPSKLTPITAEKAVGPVFPISTENIADLSIPVQPVLTRQLSSPSSLPKRLIKRASRILPNYPPQGDYRLTIWQQLTSPDIGAKTPVWPTLLCFAIHIAVYWLIYSTHMARQMWLDANDVSQGAMDGLHSYRRQYGRGLLIEFVSEGVAVAIERLMLSIVERGIGYKVTAFSRSG